MYDFKKTLGKIYLKQIILTVRHNFLQKHFLCAT